jgi:hypothetical protein
MAMRTNFEAEQQEAERIIGEEVSREHALQQERRKMAVTRHVDSSGQLRKTK